MPKIAIITDSDASIPIDLAEKLQIVQVPITIHFENETYTTNLDIDDQKLFQIIDLTHKLPTTSAPPPNEFTRAYQNAFSAGADSIICITVSSKISATFAAAESARELYPEKDITVVDSEQLCMGQGFMAIKAAELAAEGVDKATIIASIASVKNRLHMYAALPTLKYLAMGGRVKKLAASMADAINVKPILTARDGKLELLEKVRTQKKAEKRLIELMENSICGKSIEKLAMIHVNNLPAAKNLFANMQEKCSPPENIIYAEFTPGLSVHAGSGVIGFVILTNA